MSNLSSSPVYFLPVKSCEIGKLSIIRSSPVDKEQARIAEIAQGNDEALVSLISDWKNPIYVYFLRSLSNSADADDLTQKFFHRVYKGAASYQPNTIARNLLIDEFKKRSRRPKESSLPDYPIADESDSRQIELKEILSHELTKLPENQRTALLLRVQQELSYREIAEIMQANETNVKTWIFRARSLLKKNINLDD
jgi:RNA polymerase sigma-70 factor (ECF subfamily)